MIVTHSWEAGLGEILARRGITGSELGAAVGLTKMSVSRYRRGTSRPDAETVRRVNEQAAKLVGVPEVRDYLDALAMLDRLIEPDKDDIDRAFGAAEAALRAVESHFISPDAVSVMLRSEIASGARKGHVVGLLVSLAAARGTHLLRRLDGRSPRELFIDEIAILFKRAGFPLDRALRTDDETHIRRIRERFEIVTEHALKPVPPRERQAVLAKVLIAFNAAMEERADLTASTPADAVASKSIPS